MLAQSSTVVHSFAVHLAKSQPLLVLLICLRCYYGKSWDLARLLAQLVLRSLGAGGSNTLLRCSFTKPYSAIPSCKIPTFARIFDLFALFITANLGTLRRLLAQLVLRSLGVGGSNTLFLHCFILKIDKKKHLFSATQ